MKLLQKASGFMLLLIYVNTALAQHVITGYVYDKDTKQPLQDVIISFNARSGQTLSDSSGKFKALVSSYHTSFLFKKLGYNTYNLAIERDSSDQTPLRIYLVKKPVNLVAVDVTSEKLAPMVRNKKFYIDDYFILPNKNFFLTTYYPGEKGFNVVMANLDQKLFGHTKIGNEESGEFFLDCMGNLHILSDKYARQLFSTSDTSFQFFESARRREFDSLILPCSAKIDKALFFTTFNKSYTFVREGVDVHVNSSIESVYKVENKKRTAVKTITYDKGISEMYRDEINFQNMREQLGIHYSPYDILIAYDCIFRKIYAPVFKKNDSIVLFDFSDKEIDIFNKEAQCLKKIPIDVKDFPQFHEFQILCDRVTSQFYLLVRKQGGQYLEEINIYSGSVSHETKLEKALAYKVQVYDGEIYYIVKEHEWDDTSYLYRQRF